MIVILDAMAVYSIINSSLSERVRLCQEWFYVLLSKGVYITSSDITDYEVRRELIRKRAVQDVKDLDSFRNWVDFLPVTAEVLEKAAEFWAETRNIGKAGKDNKNIDADMILLAQYDLLKTEYPGRYIVIATDNVNDFEHYAEAQKWEDIKP